MFLKIEFMKNPIDTVYKNISFHAQQSCIHNQMLAFGLKDLENAKASFRDWLSVFLQAEETKRAIVSLAELVAGPGQQLFYIEYAQTIMAKKLVAGRKNKNETLLFAELCRYSPIVKHAKGNYSKHRKYCIVAEEVSEIITRTA